MKNLCDCTIVFSGMTAISLIKCASYADLFVQHAVYHFISQQHFFADQEPEYIFQLFTGGCNFRRVNG